MAEYRSSYYSIPDPPPVDDGVRLSLGSSEGLDGEGGDEANKSMKTALKRLRSMIDARLAEVFPEQIRFNEDVHVWFQNSIGLYRQVKDNFVGVVVTMEIWRGEDKAFQYTREYNKSCYPMPDRYWVKDPDTFVWLVTDFPGDLGKWYEDWKESKKGSPMVQLVKEAAQVFLESNENEDRGDESRRDLESRIMEMFRENR